MKKKINILWIFAVSLLVACTPREEYTPPGTLTAETPNETCDFPEAHQFDFWIGDWELTWGDSGSGTNRVEHILNSCIIQENLQISCIQSDG